MKRSDVCELIQTNLPIAQRLGLFVQDVSETGLKVHLPFDRQLLNHTGTVHASAQFAAAETAALAAGLLFLNGLTVTCTSKSCELRFRKPAQGDLWASAQLASSELSEIQQRLVSESKVDVQVLVEVVDAHAERVAEGTVTLALRRL
jgi:uncharacterized protein (TIGR00369 family)